MTVQILTGDCRTVLRTLPEQSVQTVVTSPPYWGVRDFKVKPSKWADGWKGAYGLEPSYQQYLAHTVEIFREVQRVLRDDGTLWLNMGDCYANTSCGWAAKRYMDEDRDDRTFRDKPFNTFAPKKKHSPGGYTKSDNGRAVDWGSRSQGLDGSLLSKPGLKQKDKVGMPWRVAFALQDDGWYLRQEVIWHKKNPMPESIFDRPVTAHEQLFLFSKSGDTLCWRHQDGRWVYERPEPNYRWRHRVTRDVTAIEQKTGPGSKWFRFNLWRGFDYYYDAEAIKEPVSLDTHARIARSSMKGGPVPAGWDEGEGHHGAIHRDGRRPEKDAGREDQGLRAAHRMGGGAGWRQQGLREPGVNPKYALERNGNRANPSYLAAVGLAGPVSTRNKRSVWSIATHPFKEAHFATFPPKLIEPCILAGCPKGGTVLDPFGGAGTTGLVADLHGRNAILIEINAKYAAMAEARIAAALEKRLLGPAQKKRHAIRSSGKLKPVKGLPLLASKKAVTRDAQEQA